MLRMLVSVLLVVALVAPATASEYVNVTVTRRDGNLYKVDGRPFWIRTRYCYEYVYGERSALTNYEIIFIESDYKCDVREILKEMQVDAGRYRVSVTQENDDLYSTLDGIYIRTSLCLELSIGDDAVLDVGPHGIGTLYFDDGETECSVEGLLTKIRI